MFENKKIFILGMARSGYNVAKLLYKNNEIVITDKNDQDEEKVKELESLGVKFIKSDKPLEYLTIHLIWLLKIHELCQLILF